MSRTFQPNIGPVQIKIPAFALNTAGSPSDLASIVIPTNISNYVIKNAWVRAVTAAGTLIAATIDIRTAAGGAGSSILSAPTALTGLTGVGTVKTISALNASTLTAPLLYVRQTVDSLNAGTVMVTLELVDLS
jgi:hypothetical protein